MMLPIINSPLITTRKSYWKAAIAEFLGYIRGYDNAADFRKLGTKHGMQMLMKMPLGLPIHIVRHR